MAIAKPSLVLAVTLFLKFAHAAPTTDGIIACDSCAENDACNAEEGVIEYKIEILPEACECKFDECYFDYDINEGFCDFDIDCDCGWDCTFENCFCYTEDCDEYIEITTKTTTVCEEKKKIYRNYGQKKEECIPCLYVEEDGNSPYIFWEEKTLYALPCDDCSYYECIETTQIEPCLDCLEYPKPPEGPVYPTGPACPLEPECPPYAECHACCEYIYYTQ